MTKLPRKADTVIVKCYHQGEVGEHPAIITRSITKFQVNLMVLPDGGTPYPLLCVPFSEDKPDSIAFPHAYWPVRCDSESLR